MAANIDDFDFDPDKLRQKYKEERDKRIRSDGNDQYKEVKGDFSYFVEDPYVEDKSERNSLKLHTEIAIIGGGFGGMLAAARIREAGFDGEADTIEQLMRDLSVASDYLPDGVSEMIQTAFSTAYSEAAENGDLSDVDLRAALRAADPTDGVLSGILNQSDINIMGKAQELIDEGATPQDVRDFFFQEILKRHEIL